jgi:hypothetical protein
MQVLWLFGGVIAFTILAIVFTTWKERRRSRQLGAAASRLGLSYRSAGGELLAEGLDELPLLALGTAIQHGTVSNVVTGTIAGVSVIAFDYAYWTGSLDKQPPFQARSKRAMGAGRRSTRSSNMPWTPGSISRRPRSSRARTA